jgi:protein-disulfide isomerase
VPLLDQLIEKYPKDVKVVFRNFPLRSHKFAAKAAAAALAAQDQGKFWPFHDALFKNYRKLNQKKIDEIVKTLNLDKSAFDKAVKDPAIQSRIRKDVQDGRKAGVRGTPSVFLNGKIVKDKSLQGFLKSIQKEINKKGN